MAFVRKVLGQVNPTLNADTTLYTVPASTSTVVSSLVVANLSETGAVFRVAVRPAGEAIADKHYLYFDVELPGNDTFAASLGMTLATTDVVTVRASTGDVAFNLFGEESS